MPTQVEETKAQVQPISVDLQDVSLEQLEEMDDSVLAGALRRLQRETAGVANGPTAHTNTVHTNTWNNSWF